ncbi:DNA-binding protein [Frankia sp. AiPa1]|uniref:DNA-binding protein n=1 Tax=Frankia sp. AiPa1 TaxID=573492 RepID=UPI00202B4533|nr:DNA-binding protein [Frankia sp. AiPa1]MCL9758921.1 DNA-binding protein [Frankia sp. AiPa1]
MIDHIRLDAIAAGLWTTADIAHRLTVSAQRARQLCARADFPRPAQSAPYFDLWRAGDVEVWLQAGQSAR